VGAASFSVVLERAAERDDAAFAELWLSYQPSLLRYLRTMHPAAAEDLASETWLAAARGLRSFVGDEPAFRAWLFTIARRRAIDLHRATKRRPASAMEDVPEQGVPDAADRADERMSTYAALELIRQLPPDQSEVVILRSIAGLDVGQVAVIVGKRPGTVRVLAHRGLRRLKDLVEAGV
jgi:RNA polymerase sigma-70 factor (ECF subfamily)